MLPASGVEIEVNVPYANPDKQRAYQREWTAKRRHAYLQDKVCAVCGTTERLELDHRDRLSKVSHNIWSWTEARRASELLKCQVLCHAHHIEKTRIDGSWQPTQPCGTQAAYSRDCKCQPCRSAHASHVADCRRRNGRKRYASGGGRYPGSSGKSGRSTTSGT